MDRTATRSESQSVVEEKKQMKTLVDAINFVFSCLFTALFIWVFVIVVFSL